MELTLASGVSVGLCVGASVGKGRWVKVWLHPCSWVSGVLWFTGILCPGCLLCRFKDWAIALGLFSTIAGSHVLF